MRSVNLSDVDLIGLIGRHGIPHARAIARRAHLNPNIARLTRALGAAVDGADTQNADVDAPDAPAPRADAAEEVRARLRDMMRPANTSGAPAPRPIDWDAATAAFPRLLSTALSGSDAFFHTALADMLDISFAAAQALGDDHAPGLTTVLHALDLPVEQAFLLAALAHPLAFAAHGQIAGFVRSYRNCDRAAARKAVEAWRAWDMRRRVTAVATLAPVEVSEEPANDTGQAILKVS